MLNRPTAIERIKERIEEKHKGDAKQLEVIFSTSKRLLVEAPAGYGKTHTMVSRIAYMVVSKQIPSPKRMLALTFSVNAAYKIKKDVSKDVPELTKGIFNDISIGEKSFVSNYHGFCRSILKKYGYKLHSSLSNLDTLHSIDEGNTLKLMQTFKSLSVEDAEFLSRFNDSVKRTKWKSILNDLNRYNSLILTEILPKGFIPYNGIITLTIGLFKDYPRILSFYQNFYTAIIVDEFQDTNFLSYWLLNQVITEKTSVIFLGDSLQRIYGFIGAIPNLLSHAEKKYQLSTIKLDKNYRFASNINMLQLDKIIRENAITPFKGNSGLKSIIEFKLFENQEEESQELVKQATKLTQDSPNSNVAILVKQRGQNVNHIIETFRENGVPFFYGLFTDEDVSYISFNKKCLFEFTELLKQKGRVTKKLGDLHIKKVQEGYISDNSPLINALFELLEVFWIRLFDNYSVLSNDEKINLIKDTFEHNGLKQYMEFLDSKIIVSTVHAAKGLEWSYVILPDMEQDLFPNWFGFCSQCGYRTGCNLEVEKANESKFLEELSVFYVAVTRARKQVYFSASRMQLDKNNNPKEKNISCFLNLPGMENA